MLCRTVLAVVVLIALAFPQAVSADGLVYELPEDGAWVRYDIRGDQTVTSPGGESESFQVLGSLRLSSVGRRIVNGESCRWIEIATEISPPESKGKFSRVLKLLVPEKRLRRGEDPLAHVLEMYYSQGGGLLEETLPERIAESEKISGTDYARRRYEVDRIRAMFPAPFEDQRTETAVVETPLGRLECERLSGKSHLPESLLRGGGSWAWTGEFTCLLDERIPFGVVRLESRTKGHESTPERHTHETNWVLSAAETGRNAVSSLPNPE